MDAPLIKIIEEIQQRASTCETVARDKDEEALTGASDDKDRNKREAREWKMKSEVWREAETMVRGFLPTPAI